MITVLKMEMFCLISNDYGLYLDKESDRKVEQTIWF